MRDYCKDLMNSGCYTDRSSYMPPFTETLWDFSLRYYQLAGIETACLSVQNEYAGNVLLILWNKWLDQQGCHIDKTCHKELSSIIIQQCEMTLAPLRSARKGLKDAIVLNQVQKAQQKHSILSVELVIEQEMLVRLYECTDKYICDLAESTNNIRHLCETEYLSDYLLSINAKQALRDVLLVPV